MKGFLDEVVWQFVFPLLMLSYGALCFVIFDAFHISNTSFQVLIAIAPFLSLAYVIWKNDRRWRKRDVLQETPDRDQLV